MYSYSDSTRQSKPDEASDVNFQTKETQWIEILEEEEIKKIEAYLDWEQEYYLINQSYLLENN